jgi:hypothetical protein
MKENKILPEKIAFMKNEELIPEKYEEIFKKKEIHNLNKENKGSTAFECKKCHERNAEIQFPLFGINCIETFLNRNDSLLLVPL